MNMYYAGFRQPLRPEKGLAFVGRERAGRAASPFPPGPGTVHTVTGCVRSTPEPLGTPMRAPSYLTGAFLLSCGVLLGRALPQDGGPDPTAHMSLGPMHEAMAARAGEYSVVSRVSMTGMGPVEAPGMSEVEAGLGGRFLLERTRAT